MVCALFAKMDRTHLNAFFELPYFGTSKGKSTFESTFETRSAEEERASAANVVSACARAVALRWRTQRAAGGFFCLFVSKSMARPALERCTSADDATSVCARAVALRWCSRGRAGGCIFCSCRLLIEGVELGGTCRMGD